MRDIKFRAWDVFEKKMITDTVDSYASFLANGEVSNASIFGCELMQYTGLKDKNGVEIYEGDIVKHKSNQQYDCSEEHSIVEFKYGEFKNCFFGSLYDCKNHCEVIGNIYENSDILKC